LRQRSALVGILLVGLLGSAVAGQDSGLDLLHRMQQALGGANKIAAIRDYEETVNAQTWTHAGKPIGTVVKRTRWIRPNYLRLDQVGPGDTYVLYFDGTSGWEVLPDKGFLALAGGELEFAKRYLSGFTLNTLLADRLSGYTVSSPEPNVLRIVPDGEPGGDTILDPTTWLPVSSRGVSLAEPDHPVPATMRFDRWKRVQGVMFATRRRNFHSGDLLADITSTDVKLNSGMKVQDLALKPSDLKPVMSGPR